jgi:hypothetical protein
MPLTADFKTPKVRNAGLAQWIQGQGRRSDRRKVVRASFIQELETADRVLLALSGVRRVLPGQGGGRGPPGSWKSFWSRALAFRPWVWGEGQCSGPSDLGGLRLRGVVREDLRGEKPKRVTAVNKGQPDVDSERTCEGKKASEQVKLAVKGGFAAWVQDDWEMCLRACGKVVHSRWGKPGNRVKAWASAKPAVIRRKQCVTAGGWITTRERGGVERRARSLRGEHSRGRSQER